MRRRFSRFMIAIMSTLALAAPMHNAAFAGVISTERYLETVERQRALDRIDAVLAREEVRDKLEQLGVDRADAIERAAALSDAELVALADDLESMPAGGSLLGVLGVVFVVLLVLELVGITNIFNKI